MDWLPWEDGLGLDGLLIVPMVLVGIGILFEMQQDVRHQAAVRHQNALSEQRAQDEALEAYLDQMSGLLLEKDLRASEKGDEVRTLARARTLTVLERLDPNEGRMPPSGKTALMQFLVETELVQGVEGRGPIISLRGADLREAYLFDATLHGTILRNALLSDATLDKADLVDANLHRTNLRRADLSGADLRNAHLSDADLRGADLSGADLTNAEVTTEQLREAKSLAGATMPNGQKYEE
jgi:hypothetical protein